MSRTVALLVLVLGLVPPLAAEITLPCPGTGPSGPAGATGPTGPTGATGATGPAGPGSPSTTHLWFPYPNPGGVANDNLADLAANVMRCWAWVAPVGVTNFTETAWDIVNNAGGGATCGAAIYNADGSTRIMTTGSVACVVDVITTTGIAAWSLTAGTKYQVCFCSGSGTGTVFSTDPGGDRVRKIANAFPVPVISRAANACSAGAPPTTTGALTAETATNAYTPIILFGVE